MTWELCDGSSQNLVDLWGGCDENMHFATAKKHFREKGYFGEFLLIERHLPYGNFKVYRVNIKRKETK